MCSEAQVSIVTVSNGKNADSKFKNNKSSISTGSPIRYPGGKFRARKILEEYIPDGVTDVVSPFFGGGSFELFLTGKGIRVHGSDVFWLLANFWEVLLTSPVKLAESLDPLVGNVDRDRFRALQAKCIELEGMVHDEMDDEAKLAAARDFIAVNRCSFSGATLSGGFSAESAKTRFTQSNVDKIRAFDNPLLTVEHADAFDVISKAGVVNRDSESCGLLISDRVEEADACEGNSAACVHDGKSMLFLDPPYWLEEASANTLYGISGSLHKSFDHEHLHDVVMESGLPFVLTYNNDANVRELWDDCRIYDASWSYGMNKSKESKEIVIVSDDVYELVESKGER